MLDFNELIEKHVSRESRPRKLGRYYPSEIGGCMRRIWYSYNHPREIDTDVLKIFEAGNMMHDFVVDVLKSEKTPNVELLKTEMPLKIRTEDFVASGRVDDVILLKLEGKMVLVEVKSTKNISFVKKASPSHVMQLQFYMGASGIHNGIIVYIDKTNLQTKTFDIKFDEDDGQEIIKRFGKLHKHLVEKELPPAEAKKDKEMNWLCRFCDYEEMCKKDKK